MIHELKTWPNYFQRVQQGVKTFEIRRNDRDFQVGDILNLTSYNPETKEQGPRKAYQVTYILHGEQFGIERGYCVMAIIPYD